jgi:DNA invertase Pin-like site-specific DNA recombinase
MSGRRTIRCAIYTRKSSEEGLEQGFNSLDAQHAACASYITSQKHEGWRPLAQRYDDGGVSGGTLERPALQRLLADIEARRVDMVVVYKIDRLTRALTDFVRLVERLDAAGCSFVSVTQAFNTATSMGRLTLNVLLSFAQFEREVTAERIRDKIAASKKKGLWMGGLVPLGFDAAGRTLTINQDEAASVRMLFDLYLEHRCLRTVEATADTRGLVSKRRTFANGRTCGGVPFSRGALHHLLTNPVYIGAIRHKDQVYPGQHPPLIARATWDAVQDALQANANRPRRGRGPGDTPHTSPLARKLVDETGDRLTPSHTRSGVRRRRYYVSRRLIIGALDPAAWRLPAEELERAVGNAVAHHIRLCLDQNRLVSEPNPQISHQLKAAAGRLARFDDAASADWLHLIREGHVTQGRLFLALDRTALAATLAIEPGMIDQVALSIETPFQLRRRGVEARIVTGLERPSIDPVLCRTVARALAWMDQVRAGTSIAAIAQTEGVSERFIRARLPLALLSPRIATAIEQGRQPASLSTELLVRTCLPSDWDEQARLLGFESSFTHFPLPTIALPARP